MPMAGDDQETCGPDAGDFGKAKPEAGTQCGVRKPDDHDGRDHVHNGHLDGHHDTASDPGIAAEEIGNDDEFAVAGTEGMEDAVDEGDGKAEEERAQILAAFDRVHVLGDFGVRPALEIDNEALPALPGPAFLS